MLLLTVTVAGLLFSVVSATASLGCSNVFLSRPVGSVNSYRLCQRATDDPSKYVNEADWNFYYFNNCPDFRWINVHYVIDIEESAGCFRDSLTVGTSSDEERLVMCGQRTGTFSLPLRPRELFMIRFKSDYSVGGLGFNLTYVVSDRPIFPVDIPRVLDEAASSPTTQPTPVIFEDGDGSYVYPDYDTDPPFYPYQYPDYPDGSSNKQTRDDDDNGNRPAPGKYDTYPVWSPWLNNELNDQLNNYRYNYNTVNRRNSGALPTFWV